MSVFYFTANRKAAPANGAKPAIEFEIMDIALLKSHKPAPGDLSYVDLSGLDESARRKALSTARRRCGTEAWGVVDPKGTVDDPAAVFFAGASP